MPACTLPYNEQHLLQLKHAHGHGHEHQHFSYRTYRILLCSSHHTYYTYYTHHTYHTHHTHYTHYTRYTHYAHHTHYTHCTHYTHYTHCTHYTHSSPGIISTWALIRSRAMYGSLGTRTRAVRWMLCCRHKCIATLSHGVGVSSALFGLH